MSADTPQTTDEPTPTIEPDLHEVRDQVASKRHYDAEQSQTIILADHLDAPVSGTIYVDETVLGEEWSDVVETLAQELSDAMADLQGGDA